MGGEKEDFNMRYIAIVISLTMLSFFNFQALAAKCAKSLEGLEQIIHTSDDDNVFPQRLDDRLLGRFKADKGFYVFERKNRLTLGLDLGILGKETYSLQACLGKKGWILIKANYEGKTQTVEVRLTTSGGRAAVELKNGTGPLGRFKGVYPRKDMSLRDIEKMFEN